MKHYPPGKTWRDYVTKGDVFWTPKVQRENRVLHKTSAELAKSARSMEHRLDRARWGLS